MTMSWWRVGGSIKCLFLGHRRKFGAVPSMSCIRCGSEWKPEKEAEK